MNKQTAPTNGQRIDNLRRFFRARRVGDGCDGPAPAAASGRWPALWARAGTSVAAWAPTEWPETQWSDTTTDPQPWESF